MSLRMLKRLTIIVPPLIIGGFEYIRHDFLLSELSMESGNLYITLLTLLLSYVFATWMFHSIERTNERLAAEEAKRAVYEERERLAQELHDNIAQILFFLNVQLKKGQLDEARSAVSEIDHHLRQAIFNLRSLPEDAADFPSRLGKWIDEWSGITGIAVEQSVEIHSGVVAPSTEVQLFAIIREAFTNIRKHSEADHASIELGLAEDGQHWRLSIRDNGIGITDKFSTAGEGADVKPASVPNRYGLVQMRKHAEALGAELQVNSLKQGGTELTVTGNLQRRET
ncbi:sensor histidine kinase [Paenibacillus rigui]|uniref:histidine kinase n=1 Tax=Paenibacillus rigui TaxID=554312 RepID=A0A229UJC3_9BACL|nr:ATP-binding protein [Paenibacillus rigui]OXM83496.1 two-component sensor histidine kinase [Paenibacillus rigui]